MTCLSPDELLDFLAGRLDGATSAKTREHVARCASCHAIASDLVAAAANSMEPSTVRIRTAAVELAAGAVVYDRFSLDAPIGEGSMGVVWSATPLAGGPRVAIKILKGFTSEERRRFRREGAIAASLKHEGLVRVIETIAEVDGDAPAIVMELLHGESAKSMLGRGRVAERSAIALVRDVARALAFVHARGVIHRDVKPANVFVTPDCAKLLDLGLATAVDGDELAQSRITRTGHTVGTLSYMAPEQLAGSQVDARADVWALGVLLYELVSGRLPFEARTVADAMRLAECSVPPDLEGACDDLRSLVRQTLAKEPSSRPASSDVVSALDALSKDRSS